MGLSATCTGNISNETGSLIFDYIYV